MRTVTWYEYNLTCPCGYGLLAIWTPVKTCQLQFSEIRWCNQLRQWLQKGCCKPVLGVCVTDCWSCLDVTYVVDRMLRTSYSFGMLTATQLIKVWHDITMDTFHFSVQHRDSVTWFRQWRVQQCLVWKWCAPREKGSRSSKGIVLPLTNSNHAEWEEQIVFWKVIKSEHLWSKNRPTSCIQKEK